MLCAVEGEGRSRRSKFPHRAREKERDRRGEGENLCYHTLVLSRSWISRRSEGKGGKPNDFRARFVRDEPYVHSIALLPGRISPRNIWNSKQILQPRVVRNLNKKKQLASRLCVCVCVYVRAQASNFEKYFSRRRGKYFFFYFPFFPLLMPRTCLRCEK